MQIQENRRLFSHEEYRFSLAKCSAAGGVEASKVSVGFPNLSIDRIEDLQPKTINVESGSRVLSTIGHMVCWERKVQITTIGPV